MNNERRWDDKAMLLVLERIQGGATLARLAQEFGVSTGRMCHIAGKAAKAFPDVILPARGRRGGTYRAAPTRKAPPPAAPLPAKYRTQLEPTAPWPFPVSSKNEEIA